MAGTDVILAPVFYGSLIFNRSNSTLTGNTWKDETESPNFSLS